MTQQGKKKKLPCRTEAPARFCGKSSFAAGVGWISRAPVALMHEYLTGEGFEPDITDKRLHHEIYLSDARKTAPEKLKTVLRHPIKKIGEQA